ncbi:unnamed protein product, partial [Hymenolepis diminuta]
GEGDKGEEDTLSKPTPSAVLIPVGVAESETESTAHDMGKEVDIGKVAEEPQGMEGDIGEVSDAEVEETLHVTSNEELPSLTEDAKDEVKEEPRTEEQITKTSSDNISYSSENNFNRDAGSEEAKTLPKEVDETRDIEAVQKEGSAEGEAQIGAEGQRMEVVSDGGPLSVEDLEAVEKEKSAEESQAEGEQERIEVDSEGVSPPIEDLESSKADVESEAEVKQRSSREEEGKEGEEREEGGKEEGGAEA